MNEKLESLRASVSASLHRTRVFYSSHRTLLLSGLTLISILLIVWARLGFTLEFGKSSAGGLPLGATCFSDSNCGSNNCYKLGPSALSPTGTCSVAGGLPLGSVCFKDSNCGSDNCYRPGPDFLSPSGTCSFAHGDPNATPTPKVNPTASSASCGSLGGTVCGPIADGQCGSGYTELAKTLDCDYGYGFCCKVTGSGGTTTVSYGSCTAANTTTACLPGCTSSQHPGSTAPDTLGCTGGATCCVDKPSTMSDATWNVADGRWFVAGRYSPSCPAAFPYLTERTKPDGSPFSSGQACVEKPQDCPDGYYAVGASVCSNVVATSVPTAVPTPTPTPVQTLTPTPSRTPTPTPSSSQTPTPTAFPTPISTPFPTPVASPILNLSVSGRNVTTASAQSSSVPAQGNQVVEVIVLISGTPTASNGAGQAASLTNAVVRASLPAGLTYVAGSTSISGAPTAVETVTTSGLSLGTLGAQPQSTVVFRARVVASSFVVGTTQVVITVNASADNATGQSTILPVVVTRAAAAVPGAVQTGPADAVLAALLVSAIMTLLYVSYTHTSAYKRKEIEAITQTRDPMDFRS